jgi:ribonuclease-3
MMNQTYPMPIGRLEETIGYAFRDQNQLILALTHSSYCNETKGKEPKSACNERLEFLGDSVLSFITSRYLYETYPKLPEGRLSPIRAKAVCEKTLCKLAQEIGLGDYLFLGHGEEHTNGRKRPSILADAFEALLAAMYLDGGIEPVREFLLPRITKEIDAIVESGADLDYKTALQQVIQQERGDILEYVIVGESGPAHQKTFAVEARLNGNVLGKGNGSSKRAAEQCAAREALKLFGM